MDLTEQLNEYCKSYNINLVGEYAKVKKTTIINFNCSYCNTITSKSYKCLTKYIDHPNVCIWSGLCTICYKSTHH
jgi:hypothetical protein